ncbi:MAG: YfiR family protein [Methylococcaceae bacterium]
MSKHTGFGKLLLICLLLCGGNILQASSVSEYELKAAFLLKFAQFTSWPTNSTEEPFNLCIYGSNPFKGSHALFEDKSLNNRQVVIKTPDSEQEIKNCQLLFFNTANEQKLSHVLTQLHDSPTLTISDDATAWDAGVMITMSTEPNRITFRINNTAAREAKLALSSRMLQLAKEVK